MNSKYKFPCGVLLSLALSLLVGCGGGGGGGPTTPPQETIRNFSNNQAPNANITGISGMWGNPAMGPNGKLYLPTGYSIHVYNSVPGSTTSLDTASLVITDAGNAGAFNAVQSIAFAGQKMIASDFSNNRVLIWNTPPTTSSVTPDVVLTTTGSSSVIFSAESLNVIAGNLVIADSGNNRVLIYRGIPLSADEQPYVILGDSSADPSQNNVITPPTASTMNYPTDVAYDGTHLIVADSGNNRLLTWETSDITALHPGQAAAAVIGQNDFTTTLTTFFDSPWAISTHGSRLAVRDYSDATHSRIRVWNTKPTCILLTDISCFGSPTALLTGTSFGLAFTGLNQLIVNDNTNKRFSIFNAP